MSEAKRRLRGTRLLTLTGVGGVGKTRLALEIGREVERSFPHGVWLADLTSLRDGDLLARTVATALGLRDRSARPPEETLAEFLRDKHVLLVLDNCEHLIHACTTLAAMLLDRAPHLRILATSRQSLGVDHEVIMMVPPLQVPGEAESAGSGDVSRYDAVRLFAQQARMSDSAFTIDEHNQNAVARLCSRLEGIPLALELAAVWIRVLGPQEIFERLNDRYRFLTRGPRAMEPTHRTLLATMDWSFSLCDAREQLLWARLSVFPAPFDTDAVLAVAQGGQMTGEEVKDALAGLVDKSVLARNTYNGRSRYSMLETIREYGAAKLAASGEQEQVQRLHRDHYRQVSDAAAAGWFSTEQVTWIQRIGQEWPHIRAALDFCLTSDSEVATCLSMASELFEYWISYGAHSELRRWLDRALWKGVVSDAETAFALAVSAKAALLQGDEAASRRLRDACMERARASGDERLRGFVESLAGLASFLQGDLSQAVARLRGALDRYARVRPDQIDHLERNNIFLTSLWLSMAAAFHREPDSVDLARICREMAEAEGARANLAWGLYTTGLDRLLATEDAKAATALFLDSLRLQQGTNDRWFPAWAIEALAWACAAEKRSLPRAAALMGIAAAFRRTMGLTMSGFAPMAQAHDTWEAQLRDKLGEQAFHDVFERYAELDVDEAYSYVLGHEEPASLRQEMPSAAASVLTRRELQVAGLVAEGLSNKEIASRLTVSQRTAEGHVNHILTKLGFNSRAQIAAWYEAEVQRAPRLS
ncbi:ATP-binding protein [Nonomuraea aurantiaca]|uniref:ATP-binding protein n=1 Tax=Nonomuraea aurantiaca TaxID=2878562 RepID=UPI001CD9DAD5|nr:LuxR C-terminal-related transcriptional regulator [Nonomuraea aurantiaca]MCA2229990.1 LuxR C-terminal-related transcriptional regulator [Nonomuraea aurantiaca]